jgi:hypothetical protein
MAPLIFAFIVDGGAQIQVTLHPPVAMRHVIKSAPSCAPVTHAREKIQALSRDPVP